MGLTVRDKLIATEAGCLPAIAWRGQIAQIVAGIMYVTQNLGHIRVDH